ncbi:MAG: hypothetical protein MUE77_04410 [Sandarakinorhabdus sp.]|jgi:hypothetical protein|nr:hypothetical protein [Sandarakinorhabdus sp.]
MIVRFSVLLTAALVPAAAQAQLLAMPFKGEDLAPGERLVTDKHGDDTRHPQYNGKDIIVTRHIGDGKWSRFRTANGKRGVNSDHLAYNKPIYAMAPGRVVGCWRNAPENPDPPAHSDTYKAGRIPGAGNFVEIRHDDGNVALYAHAIPGTIPAAICPHNGTLVPAARNSDGSLKRFEDGTVESDISGTVVTGGVRVAAGQFIGRVGNSGSSSDPHLHVHIDSLGANRGTPIVMNFARGLSTPATGDGLGEKANINGPWTRVAGGPLPRRRVLVWPARTAGNATWNGISAGAFQRTFEHFTDSGMMPDKISCRNGGKTYDSTWVPAVGAFITHHGMTPMDYAAKNNQYRGQGYRLASMSQCGMTVVAVWRK